jgi:chorismate synthase
MSNSIGNIFRLTTFGESHGASIGGIIDGCPAGIEIDYAFIEKELQRRSPISDFETLRKEDEKVEFLSGIYQNKTLGTPIAFEIKNSKSNSSDYNELSTIYRPSHADYTYDAKYGFRDPRGGGRASARETAARIVGGAIAKTILKKSGIDIYAYVSQIGKITCPKEYSELNLNDTDRFSSRCPHEATHKK